MTTTSGAIALRGFAENYATVHEASDEETEFITRNSSLDQNPEVYRAKTKLDDASGKSDASGQVSDSSKLLIDELKQSVDAPNEAASASDAACNAADQAAEVLDQPANAPISQDEAVMMYRLQVSTFDPNQPKVVLENVRADCTLRMVIMHVLEALRIHEAHSFFAICDEQCGKSSSQSSYFAYTPTYRVLDLSAKVSELKGLAQLLPATSVRASASASQTNAEGLGKSKFYKGYFKDAVGCFGSADTGDVEETSVDVDVDVPCQLTLRLCIPLFAHSSSMSFDIKAMYNLCDSDLRAAEYYFCQLLHDFCAMLRRIRNARRRGESLWHPARDHFIPLVEREAEVFNMMFLRDKHLKVKAQGVATPGDEARVQHDEEAEVNQASKDEDENAPMMVATSSRLTEDDKKQEHIRRQSRARRAKLLDNAASRRFDKLTSCNSLVPFFVLRRMTLNFDIDRRYVRGRARKCARTWHTERDSITKCLSDALKSYFTELSERLSDCAKDGSVRSQPSESHATATGTSEKLTLADLNCVQVDAHHYLSIMVYNREPWLFGCGMEPASESKQSHDEAQSQSTKKYVWQKVPLCAVQNTVVWFFADNSNSTLSLYLINDCVNIIVGDGRLDAVHSWLHHVLHAYDDPSPASCPCLIEEESSPVDQQDRNHKSRSVPSASTSWPPRVGAVKAMTISSGAGLVIQPGGGGNASASGVVAGTANTQSTNTIVAGINNIDAKRDTKWICDNDVHLGQISKMSSNPPNASARKVALNVLDQVGDYVLFACDDYALRYHIFWLAPGDVLLRATFEYDPFVTAKFQINCIECFHKSGDVGGPLLIPIRSAEVQISEERRKSNDKQRDVMALTGVFVPIDLREKLYERFLKPQEEFHEVVTLFKNLFNDQLKPQEKSSEPARSLTIRLKAPPELVKRGRSRIIETRIRVAETRTLVQERNMKFLETPGNQNDEKRSIIKQRELTITRTAAVNTNFVVARSIDRNRLKKLPDAVKVRVLDEFVRSYSFSMKLGNHSSIVRMLGIVTAYDDIVGLDRPHALYELESDNLHGLVQNRGNVHYEREQSPFSSAHLVQVGLQLCDAFLFLRRRRVVHGSFHLGNVLVRSFNKYSIQVRLAEPGINHLFYEDANGKPISQLFKLYQPQALNKNMQEDTLSPIIPDVSGRVQPTNPAHGTEADEKRMFIQFLIIRKFLEEKYSYTLDSNVPLTDDQRRVLEEHATYVNIFRDFYVLLISLFVLNFYGRDPTDEDEVELAEDEDSYEEGDSDFDGVGIVESSAQPVGLPVNDVAPEKALGKLSISRSTKSAFENPSRSRNESTFAGSSANNNSNNRSSPNDARLAEPVAPVAIGDSANGGLRMQGQHENFGAFGHGMNAHRPQQTGSSSILAVQMPSIEQSPSPAEGNGTASLQNETAGRIGEADQQDKENDQLAQLRNYVHTQMIVKFRKWFSSYVKALQALAKGQSLDAEDTKILKPYFKKATSTIDEFYNVLRQAYKQYAIEKSPVAVVAAGADLRLAAKLPFPDVERWVEMRLKDNSVSEPDRLNTLQSMATDQSISQGQSDHKIDVAVHQHTVVSNFVRLHLQLGSGYYGSVFAGDLDVAGMLRRYNASLPFALSDADFIRRTHFWQYWQNIPGCSKAIQHLNSLHTDSEERKHVLSELTNMTKKFMYSNQPLDVAVKFFKWRHSNKDQRSQAPAERAAIEKQNESEQERKVQESLNHPCILPIIGVAMQFNELMFEEFRQKCLKSDRAKYETFVYEFFYDKHTLLACILPRCESSVEAFCHRRHNQHQSESEVLLDFQMLITIANCVLSGLKYLREMRIVHRDIATRNVLITSSHEPYGAVISDFGLAEYVDENGRLNTPKPVNPYNLPPESTINRFYLEKTDVWSYGVFLWELLTACNFKLTSAYSHAKHMKLKGDGWEGGKCTPTEIREALHKGVRLPDPVTALSSREWTIHKCEKSGCSLQIYRRCPEVEVERRKSAYTEIYDKILQPCWHYESSKRATYEDCENVLRTFLSRST